MGNDIIDRTQAEDALAAKDSKVQYERIFSMISDIVWRYDVNANGEYVGSYISLVADKMLGLPYGTIGNSFEKYVSYVHPDDLPTMQGTLLEVIRTLGKDKTAEYRLRKADGTTLWVLSKSSAYCQPDGRVTVFGTTSDITERKRVEAELTESKEYLNKILNSIGDPVFVTDKEHRFVLINDAFCQMTTRSQEEILGKTPSDLLPKDQVDVIYENDRLVLETGEENVNEESATDSQGIRLTMVTKKTLCTDKEGNRFVVGVIRDITDCRRAEETLRKSEEKYRDLVENVSDIIYSIDDKGSLTYISPAVRALGGYDSSELIGKNFEKLIIEEDLPALKEGIQNIFLA